MSLRAAQDSGVAPAAQALLVATEALHAAVTSAEGVDASELAMLDEARTRAFDALAGACEAGLVVTSAVRATIARVRALDAEIIAHGQAVAAALREERGDLMRRRAAIQGHAQRARSEPRVIAVKA